MGGCGVWVLRKILHRLELSVSGWRLRAKGKIWIIRGFGWWVLSWGELRLVDGSKVLFSFFFYGLVTRLDGLMLFLLLGEGGLIWIYWVFVEGGGRFLQMREFCAE